VNFSISFLLEIEMYGFCASWDFENLRRTGFAKRRMRQVMMAVRSSRAPCQRAPLHDGWEERCIRMAEIP